MLAWIDYAKHEPDHTFAKATCKLQYLSYISKYLYVHPALQKRFLSTPIGSAVVVNGNINASSAFAERVFMRRPNLVNEDACPHSW